ncbi:unnamed protein product, partial [marine sediment metagenome]
AEGKVKYDELSDEHSVESVEIYIDDLRVFGRFKKLENKNIILKVVKDE